MRMALRAAHFQLQCLYGFFRLKAGRENVFRGRGRGGGEYTVLEVKGYPGDVVQYIGDVPPGLNRKCLEKTHFLVGLSGIIPFSGMSVIIIFQVIVYPSAVTSTGK